MVINMHVQCLSHVQASDPGPDALEAEGYDLLQCMMRGLMKPGAPQEQVQHVPRAQVARYLAGRDKIDRLEAEYEAATNATQRVNIKAALKVTSQANMQDGLPVLLMQAKQLQQLHAADYQQELCQSPQGVPQGVSRVSSPQGVPQGVSRVSSPQGVSGVRSPQGV